MEKFTYPPTMEWLISFANTYYKKGWKVVPVYMYWDIAAGKKGTQLSPWKHIHENTDFPTIRKNIRMFRSKEDTANGVAPGLIANGLAVLTGKTSGIVAMDIDNPKIGLPWLDEHGFKIYDDQWTHITPHGQHLIYKHDPELDEYLHTSAKSFGADIPIDIRSKGGLLYVAPCSYVGPNEVRQRWYQYKDKTFTGTYKIHDVPKGLIEYTLKYKKSKEGDNHGSNATTDDYCYLTLDQLETLLISLAKTFPNGRPDYDNWLRIISAVWSAYPFEDTLPILKKIFPEDKPGEYADKYAVKLKDYKMGTVIKMCHDAKVEVPERDVIEVVMGKKPDGTLVTKKVKQERIQYGKKEVIRFRDVLKDNDIKYPLSLLPKPGMYERIDNLCEEAEMLKPTEVIMVFARPAAGKSTLSMETFNRCSYGLPFWNDMFTPKRPLKTLYFHADRNEEKFCEEYLPRIHPYDPDNMIYVYINDFLKHPVLEDINFDISNYETRKFVQDLVVQIKPDIVVFDTLSQCASSIDFNKNEGINDFMKYWVQFATHFKIVLWLVHHCNKRTDPKFKNTDIDEDDYGGVRAVSGALAASFIINQSHDKEDPPGTFKVSMGKKYTRFTPFKYQIINEMIGLKKKITFKFLPTEDETIAPPPSDYDMFKINMYLAMEKNGGKIPSVDIKKLLGVGTSRSVYSYRTYRDRMIKEALLNSDGVTSKIVYTLTQKGIAERDALNINQGSLVEPSTPGSVEQEDTENDPEIDLDDVLNGI